MKTDSMEMSLSIFDDMEEIKPFSEYPEEDRKKIFSWIKENLFVKDRINYNFSGYTIKQRLTSETGVYVRTEQFQEAMTEAGFKSVPRSDFLHGKDYFYNVRVVSI